MLEERYRREAEDFRLHFKPFVSKRLVLYGIGRFSATLIPQIRDSFQIVGLMDRDPDNIGKMYYGIPVLSLQEAEERADLVIINTSATYWDVIAQRISDIRIPVYYLDGTVAEKTKKQDFFTDNPYWKEDIRTAREAMLGADVITFDIFDTLIARQVFLPEDVFRTVAVRIGRELSSEIDFISLRREARAAVGDHYTLDELYAKIADNVGSEQSKRMKEIELQEEKRFCVPRKDMISLCKDAMSMGKQVYLISDMYLPSTFVMELLDNCGLKGLSRKQIWISCEKGANKSSGSLWQKFLSEHEGESILHFGDQETGDVDTPRKMGIRVFHVLNGVQLLSASSAAGIVPKVASQYSSILTGLIVSRIFNSPFSLHDTRGRFPITKREDMGYVVLGPVVVTFLLWLAKNAEREKLTDLYFFARDGYFLERDFRYLKELCHIENAPKAHYLPISRQLVWTASISNETDLEEIMKIPYTGTFEGYLENRFNVKADHRSSNYNELAINSFEDIELLKEWIKPYREQLWDNIQKDRENYKKYLNSCDFSGNYAFVDLGAFGTIIRYLSRIMETSLTCYNVIADERMGKNGNHLISCFRGPDGSLQTCALFRNQLLIESFLTAPHGMIKRLDVNGKFVCAPISSAQRCFYHKEEINNGILELMRDLISCGFRLEDQLLSHDLRFVDEIYFTFYCKDTCFSEEVKKGFVYENQPTMQKGEQRVFD